MILQRCRTEDSRRYDLAVSDMNRLTGDERFTIVDTPVRDFWAHALSNLQENTARGMLAEYLVAREVRAARDRIEWDAYDVRAPDGTTIEVKTSGHSQSRARTGTPAIAFPGCPGEPARPRGTRRPTPRLSLT